MQTMLSQAKGINASNAGLKMSANFVQKSVERQNLETLYKVDKKIFSDVKLKL